MEIKGKIALITGGGTRVGRAITLGLAEAGAHVVIHYNRSAGPAQETAERARDLGARARPVQANLADPAEARQLAQVALEHFGRVDVLVHSASPFIQGSLHDTRLDTWRLVMGVLVESFFLLAQELTPGMVERGEGAIVTILDRGTFDPWPKYLAHGVGKTALWALTRSLAVELAPQVRVNSIVPGPVLPPPGFTPQETAYGAKNTLLGRWGEPGDVVEATLFMIRSAYVTGEVLFVDGGERWAHRKTK